MLISTAQASFNSFNMRGHLHAQKKIGNLIYPFLAFCVSWFISGPCLYRDVIYELLDRLLTFKCNKCDDVSNHVPEYTNCVLMPFG